MLMFCCIHEHTVEQVEMPHSLQGLHAVVVRLTATVDGTQCRLSPFIFAFGTASVLLEDVVFEQAGTQ